MLIFGAAIGIIAAAKLGASFLWRLYFFVVGFWIAVEKVLLLDFGQQRGLTTDELMLLALYVVGGSLIAALFGIFMNWHRLKVTIANRKAKMPVASLSRRNIHLVAALFGLLVAALSCVPLIPVYLTLFVSFPPLDETQVITGTVEVVERFSPGRLPYRYFVVDESGSHEVYCGLPTKRYQCFMDPRLVQGATGTVWFHPTFGLVKWDLRLHHPLAEGRREERAYEVEKSYFDTHFDFVPYQIPMLTVLALLALSTYHVHRFLLLGKETRSPSVREAPVDRRCPYCQKITPADDPTCIWCHEVIEGATQASGH
jgi:hypothetical protein